MLQLTMPRTEFWNEQTNEFVYVEETVLRLEHSLLSISKWESKWNKAFLTKKEKSAEEILDYIRCMSLDEHPDYIYQALSAEQLKEIDKYISLPMTATRIISSSLSQKENGKPKDVITSELVYYWMLSYQIPKECENWHLNKLMALIQVFNAKNTPPKKGNMRDIMKRNSQINDMRRRMHHTKG